MKNRAVASSTRSTPPAGLVLAMISLNIQSDHIYYKQCHLNTLEIQVESIPRRHHILCKVYQIEARHFIVTGVLLLVWEFVFACVTVSTYAPFRVYPFFLSVLLFHMVDYLPC